MTDILMQRKERKFINYNRIIAQGTHGPVAFCNINLKPLVE